VASRKRVSPGQGWGGGSRALSLTVVGIGGVASGWEVVELSPARASEQRRVQGRRRVKTDAIDWRRSPNLGLAGHGIAMMARAAAVTELRGWAMHHGRRAWPGLRRTIGCSRLDRCFPGLTMVLPDVLGTRVGRDSHSRPGADPSEPYAWSGHHRAHLGADRKLGLGGSVAGPKTNGHIWAQRAR
jgi:transposase